MDRTMRRDSLRLVAALRLLLIDAPCLGGVRSDRNFLTGGLQMAPILAATNSGVVRVDSAGVLRENGSPDTTAFLAVDRDRVFAATPAAAIWSREANGRWLLVNAKAVADEVWSFAVDPELPGRMYLGVSPALLY